MDVVDVTQSAALFVEHDKVAITLAAVEGPRGHHLRVPASEDRGVVHPIHGIIGTTALLLEVEKASQLVLAPCPAVTIWAEVPLLVCYAFPGYYY